MTDVLKFSEGVAIQFTEGCYSDFQLAGAFVTIKAVDLVALGKQYIARYAGKQSWGRPGFAAWLIVEGYVFPAQIQEIHIDDGYDFDLHLR